MYREYFFVFRSRMFLNFVILIFKRKFLLRRSFEKKEVSKMLLPGSIRTMENRRNVPTFRIIIFAKIPFHVSYTVLAWQRKLQFTEDIRVFRFSTRRNFEQICRGPRSTSIYTTCFPCVGPRAGRRFFYLRPPASYRG